MKIVFYFYVILTICHFTELYIYSLWPKIKNYKLPFVGLYVIRKNIRVFKAIHSIQYMSYWNMLRVKEFKITVMTFSAFLRLDSSRRHIMNCNIWHGETTASVSICIQPFLKIFYFFQLTEVYLLPF